MSKDQTTQPTPRIKISVDKSPAPLWAGLKFSCANCTAEYQLEAADRCGKTADPDFIQTPACWTCGQRNIISILIAGKGGKLPKNSNL